MSTVYVAHENARLNYTPAARYGEIHFVTGNEFSPIPGSPSNKRIMAAVATMAELFDPGRDYLLLSGDPIIIGICMAALAQSERCGQAGYYRVLKWDGQSRSYVPHLIPAKMESR